MEPEPGNLGNHLIVLRGKEKHIAETCLDRKRPAYVDSDLVEENGIFCTGDRDVVRTSVYGSTASFELGPFVEKFTGDLQEHTGAARKQRDCPGKLLDTRQLDFRLPVLAQEKSELFPHAIT